MGAIFAAGHSNKNREAYSQYQLQVCAGTNYDFILILIVLWVLVSFVIFA